VQFDDGLNTMKLLTQRFEALHFMPDSANQQPGKFQQWIGSR